MLENKPRIKYAILLLVFGALILFDAIFTYVGITKLSWAEGNQIVVYLMDLMGVRNALVVFVLGSYFILLIAYYFIIRAYEIKKEPKIFKKRTWFIILDSIIILGIVLRFHVVSVWFGAIIILTELKNIGVLL